MRRRALRRSGTHAHPWLLRQRQLHGCPGRPNPRRTRQPVNPPAALTSTPHSSNSQDSPQPARHRDWMGSASAKSCWTRNTEFATTHCTSTRRQSWAELCGRNVTDWWNGAANQTPQPRSNTNSTTTKPIPTKLATSQPTTPTQSNNSKNSSPPPNPPSWEQRLRRPHFQRSTCQHCDQRPSCT